MDMLQLQLFISVSQTLSFTKTAKEFYMAQPTVSNHIKALERDIGVLLLIRDNRKVVLTSEGQEFLAYAEKILMTNMEAKNRLENMAKGQKGHISVAMIPSAAKLFSECLTEYSKKWPEVQVDICKLEGVEIMKAFNRRDYDVYFTTRHLVPLDNSLIVTGVDQLCLYAHKSIAGEIDMSNWGTLQSQRFITVSEIDFAMTGQVRKICENRGIAPDILYYSNQADMILLAVNSGIGVSILPPGLTYYFNFPNVVAMPIDGEDAIVKSVVAWNEEVLATNLTVRDFINVQPLRKFMQV